MSASAVLVENCNGTDETEVSRKETDNWPFRFPQFRRHQHQMKQRQPRSGGGHLLASYCRQSRDILPGCCLSGRAANKWIKRIRREHKGLTHVLLAPEFHKEWGQKKTKIKPHTSVKGHILPPGATMHWAKLHVRMWQHVNTHTHSQISRLLKQIWT